MKLVLKTFSVFCILRISLHWVTRTSARQLICFYFTQYILLGFRNVENVLVCTIWCLKV